MPIFQCKTCGKKIEADYETCEYMHSNNCHEQKKTQNVVANKCSKSWTTKELHKIATIRKFFETSENVSNLIYLTIAYAGKVQA